MIINKFNFEKIYRSYFKHISTYVLFKVPQMSDAEDVVSSVFMSFYQEIQKKDREIENVEAYLVQMAKHELSRFYKKRAKTILLDDLSQDYVEMIEDDIDLEEKVFNQWNIEYIEQKMTQLPELDQRIFVAKLKFDMSFKEISSLLNVKENSVKTRYYRSLQMLRSYCIQEV